MECYNDLKCIKRIDVRFFRFGCQVIIAVCSLVNDINSLQYFKNVIWVSWNSNKIYQSSCTLQAYIQSCQGKLTSQPRVQKRNTFNLFSLVILITNVSGIESAVNSNIGFATRTGIFGTFVSGDTCSHDSCLRCYFPYIGKISSHLMLSLQDKT